MNWVKQSTKAVLRPVARWLVFRLVQRLRSYWLADIQQSLDVPWSYRKASSPAQSLVMEPAAEATVAASPFVVPLTASEQSRQSLSASALFLLRVMEAARAIASHGDWQVRLPTDSARGGRPLKIGYVGNIANNHYIAMRCLRRLGHDVELVLENGWFDTYVMSRPFWEEVSVDCDSQEEGLKYEAEWIPNPAVRQVQYNVDLQVRYQGRLDAIPEVQQLYEQAFGRKIAADRALLLAQNMGHWPLLSTLGRYDVVQFSGATISMGPFCPCPYVVFPTGSDLFISPFEEHELGLLMRAGYRGASQLIVAETNYPEYLDRLGTVAGRTNLPLMVDTDEYAPAEASEMRAEWQAASGGERFVFGVCRQSWEWKGNDRLIRAFARFTANGRHGAWRLVLQSWGPDIQRSRDLIADLGISNKVMWQPLCSKPRLRQRQQAADVVADQFVMEGYGTSVLESMAVGKGVIIAPAVASNHAGYDEPPPFLGARTAEDILQRLESTADQATREEIGRASREWVVNAHGSRALAERYREVYLAAYGRNRTLTTSANELSSPVRRAA